MSQMAGLHPPEMAGPHPPESLTREELQPAADGMDGEPILITLTKGAMPVIGSRTRDLTRLLPGTGRAGMRRVVPRSEGKLKRLCDLRRA